MKLSYIRLFVCFIALFLSGLPILAQQYQWANGGGTTEDEISYNEATYYMCTDANGNVYASSIVSHYDVYADDSLIGYTHGSDYNILLTSYNCQGKLRWKKLINSSNGECFGYGIAADTTGHIYVAGGMPNGNLYIDSDTIITTNAAQVLGMIQFDTSGHFNWVAHLGINTEATYDSSADSFPYGCLAIDNNNVAHFIFNIRSNVVMIPGDTSHLGNYDAAYNSSGSLLSIKRLQLDSTLLITGGTIDKRNNKLYVTASKTDADLTHAYIAEFDTVRNEIWVDSLYCQDGNPDFDDISPDGFGHLYVCANGSGYLIYKGDTITIPSAGAIAHRAGVFKLDTAGNLLWEKQCTGITGAGFEGLTILPNNKIGVTGGFEVNMYVKMITGVTDTLTGVTGVILSVLDTAGNILTVKNLGGGDSYENVGLCATSDKIGNLYVAGAMYDTIPDTLITPYLSIGGNTDFFILKYGVDCDCTSMPACNFSLTGTSTINTTYTGTTSPSIDSVVWSFGDAAGGVSTVGATATGLNASHVYTMVGVANLCATVYTGCGSDIHCHSVLVNCPSGGITAAFTDTGSTVRGFTYTGATTSVDSVTWNYGDGHKANGMAVIHTYSISGTYTVCATAHSACGNNTDCHTIVINCVPVSSYTYSGTDPVSFTYTGTTIPGLDSVVWNFGDGHTAEGTTATHTYSASATYNVCATVQTACGNNTHCSNIVVNCTPAAAFTDTGSFVKGFTYTGTTPELDSITWDFGDGATAAGSTAHHTYTASGSYNVCVTASGLCGSNTSCNMISVDCSPISNFTYTGISTITFTFTGTTIGLDSVFWILGDGSTATGTTVTHAYTYTGLFTPCAQVFTNCGNSSHCEDIPVNCLANASFSYSGSDPISYTYTGSTDGLDSVVWYFGDGSTDTGLNTSHYYSDSNSYNVCVVEHSSCGVDSECNTVMVGTEGVPVVTNANIQVFPNPTENLLNISGVKGNTSYRLLNMTGLSVQSGILNVGSSTIALRTLAAGVYIFEMTYLNGLRELFRVVKE